MNKKNVFYLFILIFFVILLAPGSAEAVYDYTPLEKIPGFESAKDFPDYLLALTKFAIWTVGIVALFMIIWGGFMYVTSAGNTSRLDTAKRIIYDAFYGLLVALGAWLLLYVINPDLVKFDTSMTPIPLKEIGVTKDGGATPGGLTTKGAMELAKEILNMSSTITLDTSSPDCKDVNERYVTPKLNVEQVASGLRMITCNSTCKPPPDGNNTKCDAQSSPPEKMFTAMKCVANKGISYIVTSIAGGQHSASSTHYKGKAIDVKPGSSSMAELRNAFNQCGGKAFCDKGGKPVDCTAADHVHSSF